MAAMKPRARIKCHYNTKTKRRLMKQVARYCYTVTTFGVFMVYIRGWLFVSPVATQARTTGLKEPEGVLHNVESRRTTVQQQHKTTLITRKRCVHWHYFLLILVSSAPAHFNRRKQIRKTWGVDSMIRPRWKTMFLVAQSENQTVSNFLSLEDKIYGDMVRGDYYDQYWNQTLKIQMGFEWAANYCNFSFLLKADDDVFVNTPQLMNVLRSRSTPNTRLYLGFVYKSPVVKRLGKWSVSKEEYNNTYYPDFCAGPGFVLSIDVIHLFVGAFGQVPRFRIDDVYVGMLANKTGVKAVHDKGFQTPPYLSKRCVLLANTLVRHGAIGNCLVELFRLATRTSTKTP